MKKLILLAVASAVLAPAALAMPDKTKKPVPTEIKCAVMTGNSVNIKEATGKKMFADYKGHRYFFCCPGCPAAFAKEPAKFAKADSIPTPKAAKGKKA